MAVIFCIVLILIGLWSSPRQVRKSEVEQENESLNKRKIVHYASEDTDKVEIKEFKQEEVIKTTVYATRQTIYSPPREYFFPVTSGKL